MKHQVRLNQFLPIDRVTLYPYFTVANLLEQWAFPAGMTLKLPVFEPRKSGKYRYEHQSAEGKYICLGHFKELVPDEKIVQIDETIQSPNGQVQYENLESEITLTDKDGGAEIALVVRGFKNEKDARDCEQGWRQSLAHLAELLPPDHSSRPRGNKESQIAERA